MKNPLEPKNIHAVALGKIGGKAGVGKVKSRGNLDYYTRMSKLGVAARVAKKNKQNL